MLSINLHIYIHTEVAFTWDLQPYVSHKKLQVLHQLPLPPVYYPIEAQTASAVFIITV